MKLGFDVISDLNLSAEDDFNWEGKVTSLYLIIAGNISQDIHIVHQTLTHLSELYQGIFYIAGSLEHESMHFVKHRNDELIKICKSLNNVAYLHKHVVIINGIAIMGCNGWYCNKKESNDHLENIHLQGFNIEDAQYLKLSLEKLQLHLDVQKIVLVTHSVPCAELFYKEEPSNINNYIALNLSLISDTMNKVSHWIYGSYNKSSDMTIGNIRYINNSCFDRKPYYPIRIDVST